MERKNFFDEGTYEALLARIERLTADTDPGWGRMSAAQMCAHCAEIVEVARGKALVGTPWFIRLLGPVIKRMVASDKPYPRGTGTHPQYEIHDARDFDEQKAGLLGVLESMHSAGGAHAAEVRHPLFGAMTAEEHGWVTYKHLDHHLRQFRV